ncbi:MAG: lysozyme, partial [Haemophilus parainfluenzae]|nr:lysozyme [Haemophilus parainfluenzae]
MIKRSAKYACSVVAIVGLALSLHGNEIRTSQKGLLLTGNAEGCQRVPYNCPADVLT